MVIDKIVFPDEFMYNDYRFPTCCKASIALKNLVIELFMIVDIGFYNNKSSHLSTRVNR
jgi:hypothetical protein